MFPRKHFRRGLKYCKNWRKAIHETTFGILEIQAIFLKSLRLLFKSPFWYRCSWKEGKEIKIGKQIVTWWSKIPLSCLEKLRSRWRSGGAQAGKTSEMHPIFWARTFCFVKKKTVLQIFIRISKTLKKLLWLPNTVANTCVAAIFW